MAKIDILMATYNGARYINEQIESIFAQTEKNWRLVIRDDGSTDGTLDILKNLEEKYPDHISLICDQKGNLGPLSNFNELCAYADAPYCSFSDQDDLWEQNKLQRALEEFEKLEKKYSNNIPLMVFADRSIIDSKGNTVVPSYYKRQGLDAQAYSQLKNNLGLCIAAGSTMLINQALLKKSLPIPEEARMHDTWIELVVTALGEKSFFDEIALKYRRHDNNVSGGQEDFKASRSIFSRALSLLKKIHFQRCGYAINFQQAKAFKNRYNAELDKVRSDELNTFISLESSNLLSRCIKIACKNIGPLSWERKLAFILFCKKLKS